MAVDAMDIGGSPARGYNRFCEDLAAMDAPRCLELGTLRWSADPTHHGHLFGHASEYVRSDVKAGTDVDVVADAHKLVEVFGEDSFDVVLAVSVWEHLKRPWLAMAEVGRVLRPGGIVHIETHQTFPVHGFPSDYFRFSDRAMRVIAEDAGLVVVDACYNYPAKIIPPKSVTRWNPAAEAWLNVGVYARKP